GIRDRNVTGVQTCALPIDNLYRSLLSSSLFQIRQTVILSPPPNRLASLINLLQRSLKLSSLVAKICWICGSLSELVRPSVQSKIMSFPPILISSNSGSIVLETPNACVIIFFWGWCVACSLVI